MTETPDQKRARESLNDAAEAKRRKDSKAQPETPAERTERIKREAPKG